MLTPMKRQKKGQAAPRRAAALAMALFAFVLAAGAAGGWGEITVGSIGAAVLRAELAAWNSDRTEERSPLGVLTALAMQDSAMLQSNRAAAEAAAMNIFVNTGLLAPADRAETEARAERLRASIVRRCTRTVNAVRKQLRGEG